MNCREAILVAVNSIIRDKGKNEFTVREVVDFMHSQGTKYAASTIRTHITSGKMTVNAPKHHETTYPDLLRVSEGLYQLAENPL